MTQPNPQQSPNLEWKNQCQILTGKLDDPYTGRTINFQRGPETSKLVQIDHVVPLADAWRHGARGWTPETRAAFANDTNNLLAVDGNANQAKGAKTPDQWLPENRAYHCQYAQIWTHTKHTWQLTMTGAEKATLTDILNTCTN